MFQNKKLFGAFVLFIVIFGLLVTPWPGWNGIYSGYFRALGRAVLGHTEGQKVVLFEPQQMQHGFSSLDSEMTLGNRALSDGSGHAKAKAITLDTRSIGWMPTALTIALILATPVPWRQRAWALVWGLLLVHAFILFSLQVWIWDESSELALMSIPPYLQRVLDEMEYTLITQLGASFSVPILIWILVTFQRENFSGSLSAQRKLVGRD